MEVKREVTPQPAGNHHHNPLKEAFGEFFYFLFSIIPCFSVDFPVLWIKHVMWDVFCFSSPLSSSLWSDRLMTASRPPPAANRQTCCCCCWCCWCCCCSKAPSHHVFHMSQCSTTYIFAHSNSMKDGFHITENFNLHIMQKIPMWCCPHPKKNCV